LAFSAPRFDEAKRAYKLAVLSEDPLPYYKASLEELEAIIDHDPDNSEAYAIKGLIYRNFEDFENALNNFQKAMEGKERPAQLIELVLNLTQGDIAHSQASNAIRAGDWEQAQNHQETAKQFFDKVLANPPDKSGEMAVVSDLGISMQDIYIEAQERWVAGTSQMAIIVGRTKGKEKQTTLIKEISEHLSTLIEAYPEEVSLRYYFADVYRQQALLIRKTDPKQSERLHEIAIEQLQACAELGLPPELRNPAALLYNLLTRGMEPEIETLLRGISDR
jgi:tetratricopeptide (TPR) repeat protein